MLQYTIRKNTTVFRLTLTIKTNILTRVTIKPKKEKFSLDNIIHFMGFTIQYCIIMILCVIEM